jgi:hypothetical protein
MSDDDFLQKISNSSINRTGQARAAADVEAQFHLYGSQMRAESLDQLDQAFDAVDPNDVRKVHELGQLRRNLRGINGRLIKAGR